MLFIGFHDCGAAEGKSNESRGCTGSCAEVGEMIFL